MSTPQALQVEGIGRTGSETARAPGRAGASASPERGPGMAWIRAMGSRYLLRLGSVALGVVAWQLLSSHGVDFILNFQNLPGPLPVWQAFTQLLHQKVFYVDIGYSLQRIGIAYLLAAVLGVGIGVLMGRFSLVHDVVTPYIEILRPIPAVAWVPLAILMLPTEESSIVFITFLGAFFPIVINTVIGVGQTPKTLVQAARSLGAGNAAILWHVVLPSALPSITAGLAVGMGVAWFSLLAGEMISGQYGIGYFTWNAYSLIEYPQIIVGMLCIGGLGTLSTHLVRHATRPLLRWQGDKVGAAP
ncbi:MAG TPA: ABC transporter permease [Polyangiaceae bacterium]|nr:ABC transporter permease [Polyangiaceae bacterium]